MALSIQTQGFVITEALREHVSRRLRFAIAGVAHAVTVRLSDINGPKGGLDKRCAIQLQLAGGPELFIEDTQSDMYLAIDRAAQRCRRSLARKLDRLRS